jgi:hypothetical protein
MLAVKTIFGDMSDILSYPPLSDSTEGRLKFSKLMSPQVVRFTVERGLEGGSSGPGSSWLRSWRLRDDSQ